MNFSVADLQSHVFFCLRVEGGVDDEAVDEQPKVVSDLQKKWREFKEKLRRIF